MIHSWAAWVFGVLFFVVQSWTSDVFLIRILKYWPSFVHISVFRILYFLHVGGKRRLGFTNISSYARKLLSNVNDTTYVDWLTHPAVTISTDFNNNPWLMMMMNIESKRNPNQNLALHTIRQCDHKLHLIVEAPGCPSSPANFESNGKIKSMLNGRNSDAIQIGHKYADLGVSSSWKRLYASEDPMLQISHDLELGVRFLV